MTAPTNIKSEKQIDVSHPSYKDLMSRFHRENKALSKINETLDFPNDDEKFWWDATSGMLAAFLAKAGYDQQLQTQFLQLYKRFMRTVGPRPLADGRASRYSALNPDSTPLCFSWNYDGSNESTIRLGCDIYGPPGDPLAQSSMREFVYEMAQIPEVNIDVELFDAFAEVLFVKPENEQKVLSKLPTDPKAECPCHLTIALDLLRDGSFTVKGTVTTQIKVLELLDQLAVEPVSLSVSALLDIKLQNKLAGELIRSLESKLFSAAPILPAYKVIEDFSECSDQVVVMVAWDCVKPTQTRLKIYVVMVETSLKNLRDVWTQGGRLAGPHIDQGLELIDEIWPLLYCAPDGISAEEGLKDREGTSVPFIAYLEVKPGVALPVPKLYIDVHKFGENDLEIAMKLASWFDKRGWPLAKTWVADMQEIFSHRDLSQNRGSLVTFSIAPKPDGDLRVVMYMSPSVHDSLMQDS